MKQFYFLLLFFFVACSPKKEMEEFNKDSGIGYAKNFEILHKKGYVELRILNPELQKIEKSYALVKRGSKVSLPSKLEKIEIPVKSLGAFSTSYLGMLSELKSLDKVAITTGENYIYSKQIHQQIKQKKTKCYYSESEVQAEYLVSNDVKLLVYSGFGQEFPNEQKLKSLAVSCIPNYDWKEQHPLGKAEWIKFFGVLLDKEKVATEHFKKIEKEYKTTASIVKKSKTKKPKILVGLMSGDSWNAPAGQSFMANILRDAQLDYIYKNEKGTGSVSFSLEKIAQDQSTCSIWIDAYASSKNELLLKNAKFKVFKSFKSGKIYTYDHKVNYFWEMNSIHPEWLLEDYAQIGGHLPLKKLHFYKQIH